MITKKAVKHNLHKVYHSLSFPKNIEKVTQEVCFQKQRN